MSKKINPNINMAKEYLEQISILNSKINNMLNELNEIRQSVFPGGVSYCERVQNSVSGDPMGDWRVRIEETEEKINLKTDELIELRLQITNEINQLSEARYIQLLYLRYVRLEKWEEIAKKMGYSKRYVIKLNGWALQEFEKKMNNDTK